MNERRMSALLGPRQELKPTPYALYTANAGVAATASSVVAGSITTPALAPGAVDSSRIADGSITTGDLSPDLALSTFWRLDGNGGTTPGTQFLGTTDGQPLELKINQTRALRLEYARDGSGFARPNLLGGAPNNSIATFGSAIAGGAANATEAGASTSFIGGGDGNKIETNAWASFVGGGFMNRIQTNAWTSVLGGGTQNSIQTDAQSSFLGGGYGNSIQPGADSSVLAGGYQNAIQSNAYWGFVGGGYSNAIGAVSPGSLLDADTLDGLSSESFWQRGGNAGTTPGTHFLGTTDNQALELKVNGSRAFRLEPNSSLAPNVIGGARPNEVGAGVVGATIAGGGAGSFSGSVLTNKILSDFGSIGGGSRQLVERGANSSTIAGGYFNEIGTNANAGAIGGGRYNSIGAGTRDAVIAGGYDNDIGADADYAAVAGGTLNKIGVSAARSFIGAGHGNTIASNAYNSVIAGGYGNEVGTNAQYGFIGGGSHNTIGTNSPFSSIGGGTNNLIDADSATIPGGRAAYARNYGQLAYASGQLTSPGDAQTSVHVLRTTQTTGAGELFLDGYNRRMTIPRDSAWTFDILVVARSQSGASYGWQIRGVVENSAGAAAFVGTPKTDLLGAVPAQWVVTVNVIGDALAITTLAFQDRPIRWVATVRTAEITYTP
jgi:hypothetical protein